MKLDSHGPFVQLSTRKKYCTALFTAGIPSSDLQDYRPLCRSNLFDVIREQRLKGTVSAATDIASTMQKKLVIHPQRGHPVVPVSIKSQLPKFIKVMIPAFTELDIEPFELEVVPSLRKDSSLFVRLTLEVIEYL